MLNIIHIMFLDCGRDLVCDQDVQRSIRITDDKGRWYCLAVTSQGND